jgi:serine/threonine protein kinase
MIVFACSRCGKELQVEDALAGQTSRCTTCGSNLPVPLYPVASPVPDSDVPGGESPHPSGLSPVGGVDGSTPLPKPWRAEIDREAATVPPGPSYGAATAAMRQAAQAVGVRPELYDFLAPPQAPEELGRLGHYRVLRVLGSGGMGVVFQAEDINLKRMVALKAMLPVLAVSESARQRFLREAVTSAQLDHDHIVRIYQVDEDRGVPYLAMQLLKGESLDTRLQREPRLPVREILRIGREIAEGLAAAHEQDLVHRDIKPANIWLETRSQETGIRNRGESSSASSRPRVKILDFGLARALSGAVQLTQTGAIVGTPAYMAPEQAGKTVDHRCDLFSLGCVLYRMSTGQQAFYGADTVSTLLAVATDTPRSPGELNPDLPPALSALILRLLAKRPEDRPSSARAVIEAIQSIEAEEAALSFSPKKLVAGLTARIPHSKWMSALSKLKASRRSAAAPPLIRPPDSSPAPFSPPPAAPPAFRRPVPLRRIAPLPTFVPRRRRRWLRFLIIGALFVLMIRLTVRNITGPVVIETGEPGQGVAVTVGGKPLIEFRGHGAPAEAKEAAESYLANHFQSPVITSSKLTDEDHAVFEGTGKQDGKKKRFRLEVARKQADAPWEAGLPTFK